LVASSRIKDEVVTEVTLMRRVGVIMGASRGIGAATALVLAEFYSPQLVQHPELGRSPHRRKPQSRLHGGRPASLTCTA